MKTRNLILVVAVILINFAQGQSKIDIAEPEFAGKAIFVKDSITGEVLEKKKPTIQHKGGASALTGFGKTSVVKVVKGAKSTTRIKQKKAISFIISVKDNSIDPTEAIVFVKLKQKIRKNKDKSYRYFELASAGGFEAFKSKTKEESESISFNAKKYGENSYLITFSDLEPGEYAFQINYSTSFNLFGVDSNEQENEE